MDWTKPLQMDPEQASQALETIAILRVMISAIALVRTVGHSVDWGNGYRTGMNDLVDMAVVRLKSVIPEKKDSVIKQNGSD